MKLKYKVEIHRRKGEKNKTVFKWHWKNKKSDEYAKPQLEYCCEQMEYAFNHGFIGIEIDQRNMQHIKYNDRYKALKEPMICLTTFNENGFGDDGCPHEEQVLEIKNCPFCQKPIEKEIIEKKRVTHECIKKTVKVEECEDKVTEEIL